MKVGSAIIYVPGVQISYYPVHQYYTYLYVFYVLVFKSTSDHLRSSCQQRRSTNNHEKPDKRLKDGEADDTPDGEWMTCLSMNI